MTSTLEKLRSTAELNSHLCKSESPTEVGDSKRCSLSFLEFLENDESDTQKSRAATFLFIVNTFITKQAKLCERIWLKANGQ